MAREEIQAVACPEVVDYLSADDDDNALHNLCEVQKIQFVLHRTRVFAIYSEWRGFFNFFFWRAKHDVDAVEGRIDDSGETVQELRRRQGHAPLQVPQETCQGPDSKDEHEPDLGFVKLVLLNSSDGGSEILEQPVSSDNIDLAEWLVVDSVH